MLDSYQMAQAYTEAKYPAAKIRVESMVFSDLVDSINQAYKDHDFLALQYLGTCLSSSVFGRLKAPFVVAKDLPKTVARLHRDINSAHKKKDFNRLHHLGNRLAAISVLEHAAQACVRENPAVSEPTVVAYGRSAPVIAKLNSRPKMSAPVLSWC